MCTIYLEVIIVSYHRWRKVIALSSKPTKEHLSAVEIRGDMTVEYLQFFDKFLVLRFFLSPMCFYFYKHSIENVIVQFELLC